MKTVFINCSPKKRLSATSYFIALERVFVGGESVSEQLRTPADHARILGQLDDAQNAVFCVPLYVDGIPSHVLPFMQKLEAHAKDKNLNLNVYVIVNNGFIEGRQNEPLMQVFERFCERSGLVWQGGVGIGGGVMLNVTRILFAVDIALLLVNVALSVGTGGGFFPPDPWLSFAESAALLVFFNLGVLFFLGRQGAHIRRGTASGKKYTRIMLPSFVFIIFADIFFTIVSILEGGAFRGWFARKKYSHGTEGSRNQVYHME